MPTKTTLSGEQLLVDRLIRIDQGYFERDQVRIVPTYHLICTKTGEKLAKIELVSTIKHVILELKVHIVVDTRFIYEGITENSLTKYAKTVQRKERSWVYVKFLYFLQYIEKDGSFEETVISLFP